MKNAALILLIVVLMISTTVACTVPSADTHGAPASTLPATATQASTTAPAVAKPQGDLMVALNGFGNENFLPWFADNGSSQMCVLVYDVLVYWDEINKKYLPGLAESWEFSLDALTLTYHIRKGVQFQDEWGELTAADIQYNFEMQASPKSIGQTTAARNIKSMETPDSYTLVIQFKKPAPTFIGVFSFGYGGYCQGIVCKKYLETVGNTVASQKPIGSGPLKLVESKSASYFKFEALDSHWRVVPEFKTLTLRSSPEISTTVAMLKTKEIDLAAVTPEQLADLKVAGLGTEVYPGGTNLAIMWGGIIIPEDNRYDPTYHNKDPWTDIRVRKAMTISIDRQAISNAIYSGTAIPIGVPLAAANMSKYQIPYDPAAAKQLLSEAGYPNGLSFRVISSINPNMPEAPRIMEALAGYWQQIGLDPKITVMDYNAYTALRNQAKTAGDVALFKITVGSDMLDRCGLILIPGSPVPLFQDEWSYVTWKEGNAKVNTDERSEYVDKLNQYYFENYGPIPVLNIGSNWAWNPARVAPWPHSSMNPPGYLEYVRHAQPLNTFRLFTPFEGR